MSLTRRTLLAAGALLASAGAALAFPDRPVQIIVPWAAGGGTDTVVRIFAAGFEKELGVPVNVVNRAGGNGITGHSAIANAAPDGYTIGAASPEIAFYKALGTGDLTPASFDLFSRIALIPAGVTVKADAPYQDPCRFPQGREGQSEGHADGLRHRHRRLVAHRSGRAHEVRGPGSRPAALGAEPGRRPGAPGRRGRRHHSLHRLADRGEVADGGRQGAGARPHDERAPGDLPRYPDDEGGRARLGLRELVRARRAEGDGADRREKLFESAKRAMAQAEVQNALKQRGIAPVWDAPGEFERYLAGFVDRGTAVLKELELAK